MMADGAFSWVTHTTLHQRKGVLPSVKSGENHHGHNNWSLSTALNTRSGSIDMDNSSLSSPSTSSPVVIPAAALYMAGSMAFHLGGYEFLRSAGLTTFTSAFATAHSNRASIAFSLANVAVTPVSIVFLWLYTRQIRRSGPRETLRRSIASCILIIVLVACQGHLSLSPRLRQGSIAAAFVFQNTYVSLITSQQWSFLDSIVTPRQGAAWFGALTGLGSVAGTLTASLVPLLVPYGGIIGLYLGTAVTLFGALVCADRAYAIAAQHHHSFDQLGFRDFSPENGNIVASSKKNSLRQAWALVRRVPTLRALFVEGLVYQIFSTMVNFATMRALQIAHAHDDARRSSLTGQFYAVLNGISAVGQFFILPFLMKHLEVKQIWRCIAILPFAATMLHTLVVFRFNKNPIESTYLLSMLATILFTSQVTDYSVRSVICNVAYQPLDYESRYIGKEFIGVFGNRLGRSGMSLFLTAMTAMVGWSNHSVADHRFMNLMLTVLLATTCSLWMCSTWWLSRFVPANAVAQQIVEERHKQ